MSMYQNDMIVVEPTSASATSCVIELAKSKNQPPGRTKPSGVSHFLVEVCVSEAHYSGRECKYFKANNPRSPLCV